MAKETLVRIVMIRLHCVFSMLAIAMLASSAQVQSQTIQPTLQNCVPGASIEQRKQCDDAVSQQLNASNQTTLLDDGWRLVKTPDPRGSTPAISIMHAADTEKSDINFAGLALRCAQPDIEVVLIVLEPQPRAGHPKVTITSGANRTEFEASVTQGGLAILLPQTAGALVAGDWQKGPNISVEIATKSNPVRGTVSLKGLPGATSALRANCAVR